MARRIAVRGGATDPVRGGGTTIEGDAPKVLPRDLVTDGGAGDDAGGSTVATGGSGGGVIPGGGFTDPSRPGLNPDGVPPKGGNDPKGNPG